MLSLVWYFLLVAPSVAAAKPTKWTRQYLNTTTTATSACSDESFSNPHWNVYYPTLTTINASTGGTQGDIQFQLYNFMTGRYSNCSAKNIDLDPRTVDGQSIWHNCSTPETFFKFNLTTLDMKLKSTWTCPEMPGFSFAANGSWDSPLVQGCYTDYQAPRGTEINCILSDTVASATLSNPVSLQPVLPVLPFLPSDTASRCADRSYSPEWTVQDFTYQRHPSGVAQDGTIHSQVQLNLTNLATQETVSCQVEYSEADAQMLNGSLPWFSCRSSVVNPGTSLTLATSVMLDIEHGVLGVAQTWNCTDSIDGIDPANYTGIGYLASPLQCGNATGGKPESVKCTLAAANVTGYSGTPPTMPHTSYSRSCTIHSVNSTGLQLTEYVVYYHNVTLRKDGPRVERTGTFSLYNPGSNDTYHFREMPVLDDGQWHVCVAGTQPLPWQLVSCRYLLDQKGGRLGFQLQWYCDDRDPSHAILFNATALGHLPGQPCVGYGNPPDAGMCSLTGDGSADLILPMSSVTWKTTSGPMDRGPTLPWI